MTGDFCEVKYVGGGPEIDYQNQMTEIDVDSITFFLEGGGEVENGGFVVFGVSEMSIDTLHKDKNEVQSLSTWNSAL